MTLRFYIVYAEYMSPVYNKVWLTGIKPWIRHGKAWIRVCQNYHYDKSLEYFYLCMVDRSMFTIQRPIWLRINAACLPTLAESQ